MKAAIITTAMTLISGLMMAQAYGEIHGKVFNENGETLPGVNIQVISDESNKWAVTDLDGKFKLKPLQPGKYAILCSAMTYVSVEVADIVVSPDKITFIKDIDLNPDTEKLGVAEKIVFEVPLISPDNTGMQTITAEEIVNQPEVKNIGAFVAKTTPGVTANAEGTELYFRGSRAGASLYFVDGVKIMGRTPRIPQSGIGSINVYTGGVPAKYGDVTGGVIVIETKNYFDLYRKKEAKAEMEAKKVEQREAQS